MKKLLCLIMCVFIISGIAVVSADTIDISGKSAILMEASTGKILYELKSHDKLPPASVTKVMTMLLIVEALDGGKIRAEDMVSTSELAAGMGGSQVYLEVGEQMSVIDMLKAIAISSGNDAAVAMSEYISGSAEAFVQLMNQRAKELGMNDTHFANCNGLPVEDHYTSAYDIAIMSRELLKHDIIRPYLETWMDTLRNGQFGLSNTNKLIKTYQGATGIKTGSTNEALYCLSASAKRDGMELISVVLGSPTSKERFDGAAKMLDYGFANFAIMSGGVKGEHLGTIPVVKGVQDYANVELGSNANFLLEKGKKDFDKKLELMDNLAAPVKAGQKAGEVVFSSDGVELGRADVIISEDVDKIKFVDILLRLTNRWVDAAQG